jgi:hypothetical protein
MRPAAGRNILLIEGTSPEREHAQAMSPKITLDQPGTYRIRVQGALSEHWMEYFEEMEIMTEASPDGAQITVLTGCLTDQAAVQGVLQKLYNLGFPLISVEYLLPKV